MAGEDPELHEMMKPLKWLLGKWRSEEGFGKYPTISDFTYGEEIEFCHCGQPNLQFSFYSWRPGTKKPFARAVGFIRRKPETNQVALIIAQNNGVSEVEEGEVSPDSMKTTSHTVGRMTFGKPPQTTKVSREFKLDGDCLEMILYMETEKTSMTEHLRIKYKKVV